MPGSYAPSLVDLLRVLPELVLIVFGTLIMVLEPLTANGNKRRLGYISFAGLTLALGAVAVSHLYPGTAFRDMIAVDSYSTFFRALVVGAGVLTVLNSVDYLHRERRDSGEYYALLLFSITGQCLMVASRELVMIFIGLEISSIASYVMAGYLRRDPRNNEAAIKYFLLGAFASAFLLYGIAWVYGGTGSTDLNAIRTALEDASTRPPVFVLATSAALMFTGFAFKVSAAPFHIWAADVYQGAPAPVAAFLSAGPKAAGFAVLARVFMTAFAGIGFTWIPIFSMVALSTMVIGNFCAITQRNVKRLLAYSSIAHAGYVMVAVSAASSSGLQAVMFYLAAYAFMNLGAFAVVIWFARRNERFLDIDQFAGLSKRQPAVAALFTIFLLSLIGIPLTGGFFGKFYIFQSAVESGLYSLTILGLLNSAVAAYYYLRILVVMYFHEPDAHAEPLPDVPAGIRATLWISATATIVLGVYPSLVLHFADPAPIFSP